MKFQINDKVSFKGCNGFATIIEVRSESTVLVSYTTKRGKVKFVVKKVTSLMTVAEVNTQAKLATFESVEEFANDMLLVSQNGYYGIVDKQGNTITEIVFDTVYTRTKTNEFVFCYNGLDFSTNSDLVCQHQYFFRTIETNTTNKLITKDFLASVNLR